jgi:hypothetical protein
MITHLYTFRIYLIIFILLLIAVGCSKEESNPVAPDDSDKYFMVYFDGDSIKISFKDLPKFNADNEEAIQLSYFIDTSLIPPFIGKDTVSHDSRSLYSYQIEGDDGFSASGSRGYPNNIWAHLFLGHVITSSRQVIFPDNKIDLPGAYNVKTSRRIYTHRKFDLDFTDSVHIVDLNKITPVQILNPDNVLEAAIPLDNVVTARVTNSGMYNYNILSLDNFGPTADMTWDQFQTGYWLLSSQVTMFTDTTLVGGRYKLKVLEKILVK